ncbi:MAG: hypothetical protein FWE50_00645 [Alphaproteobacteria bacterium]|nr:hypothetical protein [Alphaproteobacteria bacterium]
MFVVPHWPQYEVERAREYCKNGMQAICCPEDTGALFDSDGNFVRTIGDGVEFI